MNSKDAMVVFQGKNIRRTWHEEQWFFSVVDIVDILVSGDRPRKYWNDLKKKLIAEGYDEVSENIGQLKLLAPDGKQRMTDCANTETMFRIIQSIPSKRAEPFKRWLAQIGYERIQEIENPELAMERMKETYRAKGYSDSWIEKRSRGIAVRNELTDEWGERGVEQKLEFSILTAEISKAAFGLTPSEYKQFKGLERENLRDHMNDLELIFTMLGEAATTEITRKHDAQGFEENKAAAREGGAVAGSARTDLERKIGDRVVSSENFQNVPEGTKRIGKKKGHLIE